jgi:hypothetical protein
MIFTAPRPFEEALRSRRVRSLLPTTGNTADLAQLAPAIRERAMFSATVMSAELLQKLDDGIGSLLDGATDTATVRLGVKDLLSQLRYQPELDQRGGLQDLSSTRRINLQLETGVEMARGYGQWEQGQQADVLDEFPAQELFRAESRNEPRDWAQRWAEAGGSFFGGRMIALKDDPIWENISRFRQPYPPFDFGSGMDVRDIDRDEAEQLGLIKPGQELTSQDRGFNDDLQASPNVRAGALQRAMEATGLGRFDDSGIFIFNGTEVSS